MGALLPVLLPAIGQLASWLVGLLIRKVGPKPELVNAQFAIKTSVMQFKAERALAKRKNEQGSTTITYAMVLALLLIILAVVYGYRADADPIRNPVGQTTVLPLAIASGSMQSSPIDLGAFTLAGINFPAAFTGTTVTFLTSTSVAGPWVQVYNAAGPVSYTVAQNRYYSINMADFQGVRYLEVVSGSAEAAARTLNLSVKTSF